MFNFDYFIKGDIKKHDPNWSRIPDHPYIILMIGGFGTGKTNSLSHLISHQPDIDKICLYVTDPFESKYQLIINKRKSRGLKHLDLKLLLNTQMTWMIFIKILKNII